MPAFIKGGAFWRRRTPPIGATIDWSHPLASGLVWAALFNEEGGKPTDIFGYLAGIAGNPRSALTPMGRQRKYDGVGDTDTFFNRNLSGITVATIIYQSYLPNDTAPGDGNTPRAITTNQTASGGLCVGYDYSLGNWRAFRTGVTEMSAPGDSSTSPTNSVGKVIYWGWVWDGSATAANQKLYRDGARLAHGIDIDGVTPNGPTATLAIGGTNGTNACTEAIGFPRIWKRMLSDNEVLWASTEPYDMVMIPQYRRYFAKPASAGTSRSRANLAMLGVGA